MLFSGCVREFIGSVGDEFFFASSTTIQNKSITVLTAIPPKLLGL